MKITEKMLSKEEVPCADGLEWFRKEKSHELTDLVKSAIKQSKKTRDYASWGLCAVMTNNQRIEWGIFSAYQVAHLWKDKHPKYYAIWDKWASGKDMSEESREAAREVAMVVAWEAATWEARGAARAAGAAARAAGEAAMAAREVTWEAMGAAWAAGDTHDKTLSKLLRYGVKILNKVDK